MGRGDLPDMYAQAQGRVVPEGDCGHIRQITTDHVTCYATLPAYEKSLCII